MARLVPDDWMPDVDMDRIHVHWTAGAYEPGDPARGSYHIMIDGEGGVVRGVHSIADNVRLGRGGYAAHTFHANLRSIGVSMCCMAGAVASPFDAGRFPMRRGQWDVMVRVVAELAQRYAIEVRPVTVLTHAEVQPNLGIAQRGKWDITRLPFDASTVGHAAVGARLRREVRAALAVLSAEAVAAAGFPGAVAGIAGSSCGGGAFASAAARAGAAAAGAAGRGAARRRPPAPSLTPEGHAMSTPATFSGTAPTAWWGAPDLDL